MSLVIAVVCVSVRLFCFVLVCLPCPVLFRSVCLFVVVVDVVVVVVGGGVVGHWCC